jgi:predicted phosphoribosyltransferase
MRRTFRDRYDAGVQLAGDLAAYANDPTVLVLGLPRGGVPVAYEVARALRAVTANWRWGPSRAEASAFSMTT